MSEEKDEDCRKIKRIGNFSPTNHYGKDVYSVDGLSPTLCGDSIVKNGLNIKVPDENSNREMKCVGNTSPSNHWRSNVWDVNGLSPALTSCDYKLPRQILIEKEEDEFDGEIETIYASNQRDGKRAVTTISPTLTSAMGNGGGHIPMLKIKESEKEKHLKIRESTKKGYKEAYPNDGVLLNRAKRKIAKGIVRENHCGALQTSGVWGTVDSDYRIRKLTPVECERLQGFPDDWTKLGAEDEVISNTQRYKCIGNAVTVPVITFIINEMFGDLE